MSDPPGYRIELAAKVVEDLQRLAAESRRDPRGDHPFLRQQVLRLIKELGEGRTDGHHPLGFEVGKGDLRDCVTAYVQSHPEKKADHRLVFREIRPESPGDRPRREVLAVRPRQGTGNVYEHVCARLNRHAADRQPGLNRFGDRAADSGGNQAARQAELDVRRAIAHAWTGQQPLASSRPLDLAHLTSRKLHQPKPHQPKPHRTAQAAR